jgi:hypothetical protein
MRSAVMQRSLAERKGPVPLEEQSAAEMGSSNRGREGDSAQGWLSLSLLLTVVARAVFVGFFVGSNELRARRQGCRWEQVTGGPSSNRGGGERSMATLAFAF